MDENIGYNGAYSGAEIDAAIGAVKNKETTWDGKQDKLTGVQGQVVGFDDEGDAVAMPAPDTGVTTFNGRTGAVTPQAGDYTAAMVGARGDDWTPTADDVGAIPAPEGGTAGQVLTKTADGEAWQDAPSGLPDGGTEGQMLYKSADGAEWGDKPVMVVNVTDSGGTFSADKTFEEILQAKDNGWAVFAVASSFVAPLSQYFPNYVVQFIGWVGNQYIMISISSNNTVDFEILYLPATAVDFTPASTLTSDNVQDAIEEVQGNVDAAKPVLRTATLTTSGWSSNTQTVTVNGVVANSSAQLIYVSPANKDSATAWGEAGVFCSGQGANSLTFVCDSTPSANISVNISIQEART